VQWSYDLLDDAEKALLERCSIFTGGFDLESASAVAGFDDLDDYAVLDLLDALVRKSLLVADRSSGRTRFSMLETIRQFAEEQLVARNAATEARTAHGRYFAGREIEILVLWDGPRQREAYDWFTSELANLRTAFRWAADQGDLDVAAAIATCAAWLGFLTENYEPIVWAEELIEPARVVDHPRLTDLYALTSLCYNTGRIDAAIRYTEAAERAISGGSDDHLHAAAGFLGSAYPAIGQPERWVQWCRAQVACGRATDPYSTTNFVIGLTVAGCVDDAMAATDGLIDAAEATGNPYVLSWALVANGYAFRAGDPGLALAAARRGLSIARDTGNRFNETMLVHMLSGLEAEHGDRIAALGYFTESIGNFLESGNTYMVSAPLALLAVLLDRLGRYASAATIAGFAAVNPMTTAALPELASAIAHLRDVLGQAKSESFASAGAGMTNAAMVTYAYEQIDQARAALADVST
jgi:tetratricopeptide (TPR) repeat protein